MSYSVERILIHIYYQMKVPNGKALSGKVICNDQIRHCWNLVKVTIEGFHLF